MLKFRCFLDAPIENKLRKVLKVAKFTYISCTVNRFRRIDIFADLVATPRIHARSRHEPVNSRKSKYEHS